jgi:Adenylyl/Guanylyl and SMODS C-terminal sensor domain
VLEGVADEIGGTPAMAALAKVASVPAVPTTEQFLDVHHGIQMIPSKPKVTIEGRILPKKGFRTCDLSARGNRVEKDRSLRFAVTSCDVPKWFDVYWKVRNTGEEAARVVQLRGEITRDGGSETKGSRPQPTSLRRNCWHGSLPRHGPRRLRTWDRSDDG